MNIIIDKEGLEEVIQDINFLGLNAKEIIYRASKKTVTPTRNLEIKASIGRINLPKEIIKKDFTTSRRKSLLQVKASRHTHLLSTFTGVVQEADGISVKVLKNGNSKRIRHSFMAKVKKQSNLISVQRWYANKDKNPQYRAKPIRDDLDYGVLPKKYRYKTKALRGPSVEDTLKRDDILNPVLEKAQEIRVDQIMKGIDQALIKRMLINENEIEAEI